MAIRRVLVLEAQVPFVHGGAEILVRELIAAFRAGGYEAELVSIPFRDYPRDEILAQAAIWRLIDLSSAAGQGVDLVIPTKYPCYLVRHPKKVAWLMHQHRVAYELAGTPFSDFAHTDVDVGLRDRLVRFDTLGLGECLERFTLSETVTARLRKYNGLESVPLFHPPKLAAALRPGPFGDYMFFVSRLEKAKRVDLAIDAMLHVDTSVRLVIAGDGSFRHDLERQIVERGLKDRVTLLGRISDDDIIRLYAGALGVLFAPYLEDYGYVTLEAFHASKPVITATDSGGPLEFVTDGVSGLVREPTPEALGAAVRELAANRARAAEMGAAGKQVAQAITWEGVVERLVRAADAPRV